MTLHPIVHVVDDDPRLRKSLTALLESESLTVKAYESGIDFLDAIKPFQHGCVVLDIRMPNLSGVQVLQKLKELHLEIPAIVMSGQTDIPTTVECMRLGALNVLQKPIDHKELLGHVQNALEKSLQWRHRRADAEIVRSRLATLTPRERELLQLVVRGLSNKQIAATCNISVKTVVNHRMHLMAKTHTVNAADLAHFGTIADTLQTEGNP